MSVNDTDFLNRFFFHCLVANSVTGNLLTHGKVMEHCAHRNCACVETSMSPSPQSPTDRMCFSIFQKLELIGIETSSLRNLTFKLQENLEAI